MNIRIKNGSCGFCDQSGHDQPWPVGFVTSFLKIQFLIVTSDQFHAPLDQFLMSSDQFYMTSDQFFKNKDFCVVPKRDAAI